MTIMDGTASIHARVLAHGDRRPYRVALRHDGSGYTYGTLAQRSRRAATVLADCGLRAGDRVAAAGAQGPRFLEILLGCGIIGAAFVPMDDRWGGSTASAVLADSGTALLVATDPARPAAAADVLRAVDFDRGLVRSRPAPVPDVPPAGRAALLDYTADTGAASAGVTYTYGDLLALAERGCAATGLSGRDVTVLGAPLARVVSPAAMVLPALVAGACLVLPVSTDPAALATLVADEAVTVFPGPNLASREASPVGGHTR